MKILENPSEPFATACRLAGIPATGRQLRKWRRDLGRAVQFKQAAVEELAKPQEQDPES